MVEAVGLGPPTAAMSSSRAGAEKEESSETGPQNAPASGGRFGTSGKWVPSLAGARYVYGGCVAEVRSSVTVLRFGSGLRYLFGLKGCCVESRV